MAEELVKRGELVSDHIMLKILTNKLDALHNQVCPSRPRRTTLELKSSFQPWILDGFPRTLEQGRMLNEHLRSASHRSSRRTSI